MPSSSCLTLIVPDFLSGALRSHSDPMVTLGPSVLRIAARGARARRWAAQTPDAARLEAWQRGLLATLSLSESSHGSAAVTAVGLECESDGAYWLHADPIHLAAGLNEVTFVPLRGEMTLTDDEAEALMPAVRDHLALNKLSVHRFSSNRWLIAAPVDWRAHTVTQAFAVDHEWPQILPRGEGAGRLRRLMTELQMVLHEHPVNERRSARGIPTANALWLWGEGAAEPQRIERRVTCAGRSDYLRGVCRLHGWTHSFDATALEMIEACQNSEDVVAVVGVDSAADFETRWLRPLIAALKQRRFERLRLVLDEWEVGIDRWQWRAFWRRGLQPAEWARA